MESDSDLDSSVGSDSDSYHLDTTPSKGSSHESVNTSDAERMDDENCMDEDQRGDVEHRPLDTNLPQALASQGAGDIRNNSADFFLDEDLYNMISIGGLQRTSELFSYKLRRIEGIATPEPEPSSIIDGSEPSSVDYAEQSTAMEGVEKDVEEDEAEQPKAKKRRVSVSTNAKPFRTTERSKSDLVPQQSNASNHNDPPATTTPANTTGTGTSTASTNRFDIGDLVASVTSYAPELTSALKSVQIKPAITDQEEQELSEQHHQQQQQQRKLLQPSSNTTHYYHPCIFSHENRSALTREEHHRYIMYQGIIQNQHKDKQLPSLGPEDKALWALLQEKVEQERHLVRQWNARVYRSRISGFFNPAIRTALDEKFLRARRRVKEEYPQYYNFVQSIGLLLAGVPAAQEPLLMRRKPDCPVLPVSGEDGKSRVATPSTDQHVRGLLRRRGKICPVSLARPIWPTDENGVPFETTIEVDDRYWGHSESLSLSAPIGLRLPEAGKKLNEHDYRRQHIPRKKPVPSVATDPVVRHLVQEQNIHIALAASTMVALAKTLPSLASEWEIPVKVVLEEDEDGTKTKRIYVDKPLIPKRMSELEMTQTFYDGVLKRLAIVGSATTDIDILSAVSIEGESQTPATSVISKQRESSGSEVTRLQSSSRPTDEGKKTARTMDVNTERQISSTFAKSEETGVTETKDEPNDQGDVINDKDDKGAKDVTGVSQVMSKDVQMQPILQTTVSGTVDLSSNAHDGGPGNASTPSANDVYANDNMEYSLWTFGAMRLLIRGRLHGYISNTTPPRQVVLKSVLDYVPDIGLTEPGRSAKAGWWMSTWIRDDRLVAAGRVDVSRNQFVRYQDPNALVQMGTVDPDNPLGGVFSDLPGITIQDASALKEQDREAQEWIKPHMRMIHYILGKLVSLGPGQYILGHKRNDVSANVYKAVIQGDGNGKGTTSEESSSKSVAKEGRGAYDLHTAHQASPQILTETHTEASGGGGGSKPSVPDEDLLLHWFGTPDQIPGTFPYAEEESEAMNTQQRGGGLKAKGRGPAQKRGGSNARGRGGRGRGRGQQRGKKTAKSK